MTPLIQNANITVGENQMKDENLSNIIEIQDPSKDSSQADIEESTFINSKTQQYRDPEPGLSMTPLIQNTNITVIENQTKDENLSNSMGIQDPSKDSSHADIDESTFINSKTQQYLDPEIGLSMTPLIQNTNITVIENQTKDENLSNSMGIQ